MNTFIKSHRREKSTFGKSFCISGLIKSAKKCIITILVAIHCRRHLTALLWAPHFTSFYGAYQRMSYQCLTTISLKSLSCVWDPLQYYGLQPARLLCPWISPSKNTGVGLHSLLQGIFQPRGQTQDSSIEADSLPSEPPGKSIPWCLLKCFNTFKYFCK